ncbi:MAG: rhodanese-like domain-containing protein [Gammaproteobacteria bacterium]|nr:rhodanese-like domain-containing protein [Gammaproteobacteria bacterium]
MLIRLGTLFFILLVLTACGEVPYTNINNAELKLLQEKGIPVFDVRRPEEWKKTGVITGSRLLTFVDSSGRVVPGFFENFSKKIGKDDPVILICRTGNRTDGLARYLIEKMGYSQIYNVRHGITDWMREGNQIVRPR